MGITAMPRYSFLSITFTAVNTTAGEPKRATAHANKNLIIAVAPLSR